MYRSRGGCIFDPYRPDAGDTGKDRNMWHTGRYLSVKRCHGLGNVLCLLPVLDRIYARQEDVNLITREVWIETLSTLRPNFCFNRPPKGKPVIDLDKMTENLPPRQHRTDEFGRLLGLNPPFPYLRVIIPHAWSQPFLHLHDSIVFAPEAGHPSRQWPQDYAARLKEFLPDRNLVVVGLHRQSDIPCDVDLRGILELSELFGLLSTARAVISMDSSIQFIAAALNIPTIAIFGGIDPDYRVRRNQRTVVIQAGLDCCPCNKEETCTGKYHCIGMIEPHIVAQLIAQAEHIDKRCITTVSAPLRESKLPSRPRFVVNRP